MGRNVRTSDYENNTVTVNLFSLVLIFSLQVNHLSNSLVSLLLLPQLAESAKKHSSLSRIVIVSSETHGWFDLGVEKTGPNVLNYLNTPASFSETRYPWTKCTYNNSPTFSHESSTDT